MTQNYENRKSFTWEKWAKLINYVLAVQKCSNETVKQNAVINAFVESKKLKLSKAKCYKLHIDKKLKKRQAGAELCQAQLPTGTFLNCD